MCFFDDNDFDDCYFDDDCHVDLLDEVTEDDINDEEELINDMCDDGDVFIFI